MKNINDIRYELSNDNKFSKDDNQIFYADEIQPLSIDYTKIFLDTWEKTKNQTVEEDQIDCFDVSMLINIFHRKDILKGIFDAIELSKDRESILQIIRILEILKNPLK